MSNYEVIQAGRGHLGITFRHHFRPINPCQSGEITVPHCMQIGMDRHGFDCSGLVVASLCQVLGMQPAAWPMEHRHVRQLQQLTTTDDPEPGDALVYWPRWPTERAQHIGIFVAKKQVIHASGIDGQVEEGPVENDEDFGKIEVIPHAVLLGIGERAVQAATASA